MIELEAPRHQFCRLWPAAKSRHVFLYLHGVQSHSGWLIPSAEELARRGVAVYAPDRRGSGRSPAPHGDLADHRLLLEDLRALIAFVREREPGKKLHLGGLCWGARLALPIAVERSLGITSVVLVSPGLCLRADYPWQKKLSIAAANVVQPQKRFPLPLRDEWFTANPVYLDFIRRDELGLRQVTARFLRETFRLQRKALRAFRRVTLPLFMMLAGADEIVDVPRSVDLFAKTAGPSRRLKVYPGWRHSIEFEPNNQLFFDDLVSWFESIELAS